MILNISALNMKQYFLILLITSVLWSIFGYGISKNFAPLIIGFLGFPVFFILFYKNLYNFSNELKSKEPEIFKSNEIHYGYSKGKVINAVNLLTNNEFDKLKDLELKEKYILTKTALKYCLFSFFSIPLIAIEIITLK